MTSRLPSFHYIFNVYMLLKQLHCRTLGNYYLNQSCWRQEAGTSLLYYFCHTIFRLSTKWVQFAYSYPIQNYVSTHYINIIQAFTNILSTLSKTTKTLYCTAFNTYTKKDRDNLINSKTVQLQCSHVKNGQWEKSCKIKGGGQEMAVMV